MIKAKIVSTKMSAKPDAPIEMGMEMWVLDNGSLSCPDEVVIMTKEEYESLRKRLNDKEGEICKLIVNNDVEQARLREKIKKLEEENKTLDSGSVCLRNSLLDEREKTRKLKEENEAIQKDIKDLEEKLAQEAAEIDIHHDGTIVFRNKRVSELEKEVKELEKKIEDLEKDKTDLNYSYALLNCENITLEKKVKELEEKNKYLKKRLLTRYTVNVDADGAIIYPELKED
jgi:chromosome segregation ATPase